MIKTRYIEELSEYIKKNLKKGYTMDSLRWALIDQGHSKMEVSKAIKKVEDDLIREAPILKTTPDITYEVVVPVDENANKPFWKRWFGL